jgi:FolB domain-containing protein
MKRTVIRVEDLRTRCLIGAWARERHAAQEIRVDIEIVTDAQAAALADDLAQTVDYSVLTETVRFVLQEGRFRLLETAVHMLQRVLLLPPHDVARPPIEEAKVRLTKFGALADGARAVVESSALASDQLYLQERKDWGTVDVIGETGRAGLYRLNIHPGQRLPTHYHRRMRESELVLDPGLVGFWGGDVTALSVGQRYRWKAEEVHGYGNPSGCTASLLCIDQPAFIPEDETVIVEEVT